MENKFTGFRPETIKFLNDLRNNNNKPWFEMHRAVYDEYLLQPFRDLATDLAVPMLGIDKYLEVRPGIGKTISRIYRDTRFSKNKSVFRDNMWLGYKRSNKEWQDAPGYFFELNSSTYIYGMGIFQATPATMRKFRELLDKKPEIFLKTISFYNKKSEFVLAGENYKKIIKENQSEQLREWYQKKSFYLYVEKKIDKNVFTHQLVEELINEFITLSPLYNYLWQLKD